MELESILSAQKIPLETEGGWGLTSSSLRDLCYG